MPRSASASMFGALTSLWPWIGQEARRHLVGHDEEDVGASGHRCFFLRFRPLTPALSPFGGEGEERTPSPAEREREGTHRDSDGEGEGLYIRSLAFSGS